MILTTFTTPDGPFAVLTDGAAVWASGWTDSPRAVIERVRAPQRPTTVTEVPPTDGRLAAMRHAVEDYYDGDLNAPGLLPVRQFGTPTQQVGWQQLRQIAPGQPLSYAAFAAAIGNPHAVRAAAAICARNAPALFVPCHRVLRSDGSLGGFAWGLTVKASLLAREADRR